ncbi:hypothetical protein ACLOJK_028030 [Asimina triloba]
MDRTPHNAYDGKTLLKLEAVAVDVACNVTHDGEDGGSFLAAHLAVDFARIDLPRRRQPQVPGLNDPGHPSHRRREPIRPPTTASTIDASCCRPRRVRLCLHRQRCYRPTPARMLPTPTAPPASSYNSSIARRQGRRDTITAAHTDDRRRVH